MGFMDWLRGLICQPCSCGEAPTPETQGEINMFSLKTLFNGKVKHLYLSDIIYKLILYSSMREFLKWEQWAYQGTALGFLKRD